LITSLANIQTAITAQIDDLTKQQTELTSQAKARIAEIIQAQKQRLSEKQEIQKKVLNFLHAI
jgi:hypothetical protein